MYSITILEVNINDIVQFQITICKMLNRISYAVTVKVCFSKANLPAYLSCPFVVTSRIPHSLVTLHHLLF